MAYLFLPHARARRPLRAHLRTHLSAAGLATTLAVLPGCAEPADPAVPAGSAGETQPLQEPQTDPRREVRMRAAGSIERADFWKPRMESAQGIDPYQAPLLLIETPGAALGTPVVGKEGRIQVDSSDPAVFFARREDPARYLFLWFREGDPAPQGVRVLLHADGQPATIEVLRDSSGLRVVHTSSRLPGESTLEEPAVLAGNFALGSMPTGPYVYLPAGSSDVGQVHCRCSPTQVGELGGTREYELVPLVALEGILEPAEEQGFGPCTQLAELVQVSDETREQR